MRSLAAGVRVFLLMMEISMAEEKAGRCAISNSVSLYSNSFGSADFSSAPHFPWEYVIVLNILLRERPCQFKFYLRQYFASLPVTNRPDIGHVVAFSTSGIPVKEPLDL